MGLAIGAGVGFPVALMAMVAPAVVFLLGSLFIIGAVVLVGMAFTNDENHLRAIQLIDHLRLQRRPPASLHEAGPVSE